MSDLGITTELERDNLGAHVDLCAMRYRQLDSRLAILETKMDQVQRDIIDGQKSLKNTIIGTASTIVVSIIGLVTAILMNLQ